MRGQRIRAIKWLTQVHANNTEQQPTLVFLTRQDGTLRQKKKKYIIPDSEYMIEQINRYIFQFCYIKFWLSIPHFCSLFSRWLHFIDFLKLLLQNKASLWFLPSMSSKWKSPIYLDFSYPQVESQCVHNQSSLSLFTVCKVLSKSLRHQRLCGARSFQPISQ